jgi:hypothetical protein
MIVSGSELAYHSRREYDRSDIRLLIGGPRTAGQVVELGRQHRGSTDG